MEAYGMIAFYAIPMLTIGVYRILNPEWKWNKGQKEDVSQ
jgi:hypothetical protein